MKRYLLALFFAATGCTTIVESPPGEDPAGQPLGELEGDPLASPHSGELDPPAHAWRVLDIGYEVQETGYWCGPTATKMALSARMVPPSQQALANQLGTTTNGTDWIGQITNVLNNNLRAPWYVTREMPNDPPTAAQRDLLWADVTRAITNGFPLVANIVAPATNHPPGYPNRTIYHYFAVVGFNPETRQVYIADSANFSGNKMYWLSFDQLATLIPPKGYTALAPCTRAAVVGKIGEKYDALGGCASLLGPPITPERGTPDGVGRYSVFEKGSIYWTPALGAHEVHGRIRDAWAAAGWETGALGYPISDEYDAADGKRNDFEHGYIQWHRESNTTTVVTN